MSEYDRNLTSPIKPLVFWCYREGEPETSWLNPLYVLWNIRVQTKRRREWWKVVYNILSSFLPQIIDMKWERKKGDDASRGVRTHARSLREGMIIKTEWTACFIFAC